MEPFRKEIPITFSLPRRIQRLSELSYNLWWTWNKDAQRLFGAIDRDLWERVYHNPILFLQQVERPRLNSILQDPFYLDFYDRIFQEFDEYMETDETWCLLNHPECQHNPIAYFSTEFGLLETMPLYAGG